MALKDAKESGIAVARIKVAVGGHPTSEITRAGNALPKTVDALARRHPYFGLSRTTLRPSAHHAGSLGAKGIFP